MFDKDTYKAAFDKVTASEETYRRVMSMSKEKKNHHVVGLIGKVLIAAVLISMLAVTASAAENVYNWFTTYFSARSKMPLSDSQISYIEENEQVIGETQSQNGWTVELKSAMDDGKTAYIIIGVEAPEEVSLNQTIEDGIYTSWFGAGNVMNPGGNNLIVNSAGMRLNSFSTKWEEDGDGLGNTKIIVIQIDRDITDTSVNPFGTEVEWCVHIDDIVGQYTDMEYRRELMNGKYKDQTEIMFTDEEAERLYTQKVLAEGEWKFSFTFSGEDEQIELIKEPVTVSACVGWKDDGTEVLGEETVTSFALRSLSASVCTDDLSRAPDLTNARDRKIYVVMKDGSRIQLTSASGSPGEMQLTAEAPIILENVNYVLLADGTQLPVYE